MSSCGRGAEPMNSKIITVTIQKGGTGKTTTAAALIQAAKYKGLRGLAIDLDPQGNLSLILAAAMSGTGNSYRLLTGADPSDMIQTTAQGLDVIPASHDLAVIPTGRGAARRLEAVLKPLKKRYDVIVIDTPAAGILQYNALQAATAVVIPALADTYNIQSIYQTADTVEQFRQSNPNISFNGVLVTMFDGRTRHARQMRDVLKRQAGQMELAYIGEVRRAVAIQEAAAFQESLYDYAPRSTAAADYLRALETIIEMEGEHE